MKLILTHEVTGLGSAGDIVEVKDGYGRNYLVPRGLAVQWSKGGQAQVEAIQKGRAAREIKTLEEARGIKGQLEAKVLRISAQSGANGRLFGAVTQSDVADAAKAVGISIDKRKVEFGNPVKATGDHQATVALHPEVTATVRFSVS